MHFLPCDTLAACSEQVKREFAKSRFALAAPAPLVSQSIKSIAYSREKWKEMSIIMTAF